MRNQIPRVRKYAAKLTGDYQPLPGQKAGFKLAVGDQVAAEHYVKTLSLPALLQNHYMIFAKQVLKIKKTHSATIAADEACYLRDHWVSRGLDATATDGIITHYGLPTCIGPAPPTCAWSYKMKLTFSGNVSATNLDDFPVLVYLHAGNFNFNHAQNNGEDIRFMDSDTCPTDGTPLKHEIEKWDKPNQKAWVWVKVPRIDGNSVTDFIYMFFGNPVAPDGQDRPNVWTSGYVAVFHMRDTTTSTVTDSTSNNWLGTKFSINQPIETVSGEVNSAQDFDGTEDMIDLPSGMALSGASQVTISAWVYRRSTAGSYLDAVYCDKYPSDSTRTGLYIKNVDSKAIFLATGADLIASIAVPMDTFTLITATFRSGGSKNIYYDGVNKGTNAAGANLSALAYQYIHIGKQTAGVGDIDGIIDEVRVANVERTPDWVMGQYLAQANLLITYGAEEPS
jgi:hypothetical protein